MKAKCGRGCAVGGPALIWLSMTATATWADTPGSGRVGEEVTGLNRMYCVQEWTDATYTRARLRQVSEAEYKRLSGQAGGSSSPAGPDEVYANYDNFTRTAEGGQSDRITGLRVGGDEIGDDLFLADYLGGVLTGTGYSLGNFSATNELHAWTYTNRWYDWQSLEVIREVSIRVELDGFTIQPGTLAQTLVLDGGWDSFGIRLRDRIWAGYQFSDPVGIAVSDFGIEIAGPRTLGSGTSAIRNFTTGETIQLQNDTYNPNWLVRTRGVPSPGSLASLALAGGFLLTRRRAITFGDSL
ncbi:MAG: hypothetical protein SFZ23_12345 [Planctomycetota bacterium]|nr:hypothetical protein [Planctomycetota bacterium]